MSSNNARSALWISGLSLALLSCSADAPDETRFIEAEVPSQRWCLTAQLELAKLQSFNLGEQNIDLNIHATQAEMGKGKPKIDVTPTMIHIHSFTENMQNRYGGTETIAKRTMCKAKTFDAIEQALGVQIEGGESPCKQQNEAAMAWALNQLSEDERERYEAEGKKLVFGDDLVNSAGLEWYGTPSVFEVTGTTYKLSASSLVVPPDPLDVQAELRGVHYCKMLPPSQMLYWLLERAFWDDPLGAGPDQDEGAMLFDPNWLSGDCRLPSYVSSGSCIFYFVASNQHYCEEYTGPNWTPTTAQEKCATTRDQGIYKTQTCPERAAETATLDGDGVYKGECVVNCGTPDEFRWNVYSQPAGMAIEDACPDWYPVN